MYLNRQVNKREEQKCRDKVKKKWQVDYIAPLNHLPLLPSGPGGVSRSWSCKTCRCKYTTFIEVRD